MMKRPITNTIVDANNELTRSAGVIQDELD